MLPARFTPQQEAWTLTKRSPYDKMPNFNSLVLLRAPKWHCARP